MPRASVGTTRVKPRGGRHEVTLGDPGTAAAAAFAPTDVAGLIAWYKADSLSLADGDPVSAWTDSSTSGYNLSAALTARPTYKTNIVNSQPVVRFDGSSDRMFSGNIAAVTDDYCQFAVVRASSASPSAYLFDPDGAESQSIIYGFEANTFEAYNTPRVNIAVDDQTNFAVIEVNDDNSTRVGYKNGTQTESVAAAALGNVTGGTPLFLGSTYLSNSFFPGDVAEFLWYSAAVSAGNRSSIRSYLGTKYNITVA